MCKMFTHVQNSPVLDIDYVFDSVLKGILTSVLEELSAEMKVSLNIKALLSAITHKDACVHHTANQT